MQSAMLEFSNHLDLCPDQDKKWGLSFLINTRQTAEGRSAGRLAWAGLANTYFWIDPANGVAAVILMQLIPFGDPKALAVVGDFEKALYTALG